MNKIFIILTCLLLAVPLWGVASDNDEATVILNVKTLIYHSPYCTRAKLCTKNCVKTTLEKARDAGGRICKICKNKKIAH